ncbi:MAG: tetratricopeptide repeat protein [Thalassotalea sp.]
MSVINKMLKDLDDRQEARPATGSAPVFRGPSTSPILTIMVTVIISFIIAISAFLLWSYYQENQTLKQQALESKQQTEAKVPAALAAILDESISEHQTEFTEKTAAISTPKKNLQAPITIVPTPAAKTVKNTPRPEHGQKVINRASAPAKTANIEPTETAHQTINHHGHQHSPADNTTEEVKNETASTMTISRKQLTAEELSAQKMRQAERAVADGKIENAEALFEEILLLMPEHEVARKQLAALWYGRKAYRPALNLLQQGLAVDNKNNEFRIMQARIYLTLNQVESAYQVLNQANDFRDIEYQSLLANAAQQVGDHVGAAKAYTSLVQLSPQNGRYWLGLAVAYDSNSQFPAAVEAYQSAIIQGGLSKQALNFAKQRKEELGE